MSDEDLYKLDDFLNKNIDGTNQRPLKKDFIQKNQSDFQIEKFQSYLQSLLQNFQNHDFDQVAQLLAEMCDAIDQYPNESISEIEKSGILSFFEDTFDIQTDFPHCFAQILFFAASLCRNSLSLTSFFKERGFLETSVILLTHEEQDVATA